MKKTLLSLLLGLLPLSAVHAQRTVIVQRSDILTNQTSAAGAIIDLQLAAVKGIVVGTMDVAYSAFFRLVPLQARRTLCRGGFCLAGRGLLFVRRDFGIRPPIASPDELARRSDL